MAQVIETVFSIRTEESIANLNEVVGALGRTEQAAKKAGKSASDEMEKIPAKTQKAASGFNGLANSINQVSRELPAFAFSAQTGFLAVSNNIPILIDEINNLRKANAALAAENKATVPVWQQVVKGILSWQTAMSLAISFSVLYAKEIGNFISTLFQGKEALSAYKAEFNAINETYKDKSLSSAITNIKLLSTSVEEAGKTLDGQKWFVEEYNKTIGTVTGSVKTFKEAEQGIIDGTDDYIKAITARITIEKLAGQYADLTVKKEFLRIENERELQDERGRLLTLYTKGQAISLKTQEEYFNETGKINKNLRKEGEREQDYVLRRVQTGVNQKAILLNKEVQDIEKQQQEIDKIIAKYTPTATGTLIPYKKGDEEALLSAFELLTKKEQELLLTIKNGILDKKNISGDLVQLNNVQKELKRVQDAIDLIDGTTLKEAIKDAEDAGKEAAKNAEIDQKKSLKAQKNAVTQFLDDIDEEYALAAEGRIMTNAEERASEIARMKERVQAMEIFYEMDEEGQKTLKSEKNKLRKAESQDIEMTLKENLAKELLALDTKYIAYKEGKILNDSQERELEIKKQEEKIKIIEEAYKKDLSLATQLQEEKNKLGLLSNKDLEKTTKDELNKALMANEEYALLLKDQKNLTNLEIKKIDEDKLKEDIAIIKRFQALGLTLDAESLAAYKAMQKGKTKTAEEEAEERERIEREIQDASLTLAQSISDKVFQRQKDNANANTDAEISNLELLKEKKLISEEEFAKRKADILNRNAETQRKIDLAQIQVNTALSIIKTFAQLGFPAGIVPAALAAAEGLVQYAFASSQPLPKYYAKGTARVTGGIAGKDSVSAMLMPNEAVIPAKANMERQGLAKAWIGGDLDRHLAMNYINPAINEVNRKWEMSLKLNQQSTFIRNDNFSDKKIVGELVKSNRLNRVLISSLSDNKSSKRNRRSWN